MRTGLGRSLWLPLAALTFITGTAMARPLLIAPQNLEVPPLPGAPTGYPDIGTLYGHAAIDEGTLLVTASRPRGFDDYDFAVHIFERNAEGRWLYAGILTELGAQDLAIDGPMAAINTQLPGSPTITISVFERGATGWALTGSFSAPGADMVRLQDGSIYLAPRDNTTPLGCKSSLREFRRVNGAWTQVATVGGNRCDRDSTDINDGRALIMSRPYFPETPPAPAEVYASSRPTWTPIGTIPPPAGTGSIRGDTVYIDNRVFYRRIGGSWMPTSRLIEPEVEAGGGGLPGKLRGAHLFLFGGETDYERYIDDFERHFMWNVLRVYRETSSGRFAYHARLNADYTINFWAVSDDGRQVVATGNQTNDFRLGYPFRLYVFDIPDTTSFPSTRQDTFSTGNYSRWTATAGEFAVVPSRGTRVLRQSNLSGAAFAHLTDIDWTDQAIEADLRPLEFAGAGRWFGLITRRADERNYYYVTFRSPNVISLRRMRDGVYTELASTTTTDFQDFQLGRNYRMRLESVGDQHAVFIDGYPVLRAKDKTLSRGHPGIAGYRTRFETDNVVVSGGTRVLLRLDDPYSGWRSDGWFTATGSWEMTGHGYGEYRTQTDNEADARWYSQVAVGYQVVNAKVRPQSHGTGVDPWIGLAARVVDESNYYYVSLRRSQQLSLRRLVNGQIQELGTVAQPVTLGTTYDLRLEIIGTHIRAYVNGDLKIETTDSTLSTAVGGRNAVLMWKTAGDVLSYVAYQP